jgi:hypothetical protein
MVFRIVLSLLIKYPESGIFTGKADRRLTLIKGLQNRLYVTNKTAHSYYNGQTAHSISIAKNGKRNVFLKCESGKGELGK